MCLVLAAAFGLEVATISVWVASAICLLKCSHIDQMSRTRGSAGWRSTHAVACRCHLTVDHTPVRERGPFLPTRGATTVCAWALRDSYCDVAFAVTFLLSRIYCRGCLPAIASTRRRTHVQFDSTLPVRRKPATNIAPANVFTVSGPKRAQGELEGGQRRGLRIVLPGGGRS